MKTIIRVLDSSIASPLPLLVLTLVNPQLSLASISLYDSASDDDLDFASGRKVLSISAQMTSMMSYVG